jgi:DNA-binding response OmpR family regulator
MTPMSAYATRRPVSPPVVVLASPLARDREYLRRTLENTDIRIVEASTYREALDAIGAFGATLALCDESLEWQDLLGHLVESFYPPRVIVIAASPSTNLCAEVLNCGGDYVLPKPFVQSEVEWLLNLVAPTPSDEPLRRKPATSDTSDTSSKAFPAYATNSK